ncbi:NAD(P)-dependent oxidoreductase [Bacteroides fragilis]|uniref:NAD-dependent epimerase/dehydratase family protein n=1 Tax=Bacteroides fragilis TaxID=817 RepID=UPI00202E969E|nr:NAD(P)-dependent oxidoreductase [Bacteroides fragilis]MCM0324009.1 NAD(P)-dependent oxidoreductase [Bacteroides fragilis]MCM0383291.1 NAD(P)-dependent oxidoreductase [Bacteroides fragilis]
MRVTILGTNGFLSTSIASYCNEKRYHLDLYGLNEPIECGYNEFFKIDFINEDIDYAQICQSDIIIYAVGAGIQSNLKEGNDLIYRLNVTVPVNICNALKQSNYKGCFVTFGSVFEVGEAKEPHFFTEEEILTSTSAAPNDYTVSKRMLTRFVYSYKHEFTHWHFFIPTIYGEKENPLRLIPYVISAIRKGDSLHFTVGDQVRQYIHVSEVPRLIDLAYQKRLPGGLYNVQGLETMTVKDIVITIHHTLGKEVSTDSFGKIERADIGMKYLALDGTKLKNIIGFEPHIRLVDVINNY